MNTPRIPSSLICAAVSLAALMSACNDGRSCETSDDCFADESCVGGTCLLDEGGERRDTSDSTDETETGTDGPDGEQTSCIVDPITAPSCTDEYEGDTNNDSSTSPYEFEFGQAGCIDSEEFTPAEATLQPTQCWDEHEDWYQFQLFECRDYQFRIQVEVVPEKTCDTPLELRAFDCEDENVRCEALDNGVLRQTIVYPRSSVPSIGLPDFGVISTVDNQQVDYSITVRVYR